MRKNIQSVLFITTSFPRYQNDFAGSFVYLLAKYLVRDGIRVIALAPGMVNYPNIDTMDGIEIIRFQYFLPHRLQCLAYGGGGIAANVKRSFLAKLQIPFFFLALTRAILRYQDKVDLLNCHWLPTAVAALLMRPLSRDKPPIVFTPWGSDMRLLPTGLARWTISRVDGCVSGSVEADEYLVEFGCKRLCQISPPVDEERFNRDNVRSDLFEELSIKQNIPVITFIGRLNHFKDPITFLRACSVLKQRGLKFTSLVAGDGDLMRECQNELLLNDLDDCVKLLGNRSDPERILRISSVSANISPVENVWSNSIAEAMMMKVPVVLSNAGHTEELFTHGKDCLLVSAEEPDSLADAIESVIEDKDLSAALASGACELLRNKKKNSMSAVQELKAFYEQVLNEAKNEE